MSPTVDRPRYAIISRDVNSEYINIYSRHASLAAANAVKDLIAWEFNAERVTKHLAVVSL